MLFERLFLRDLLYETYGFDIPGSMAHRSVEDAKVMVSLQRGRQNEQSVGALISKTCYPSNAKP